MEPLKIGDNVVKITTSRWSDYKQYTFGTIARLTKTQAITDKGNKIINEPHNHWSSGGKIVYSEYGDRWTKWQIVTDEIIEEGKKAQERIKVSNWFQTQRFTDEDKKKIYDLFNP